MVYTLRPLRRRGQAPELNLAPTIEMLCQSGMRYSSLTAWAREGCTAVGLLKEWAKAALKLTPYTITRTAPNRFDALESCLRQMARRGYKPGIIVDGGAHLGSFARLTATIYPGARIHMVEPQPQCEEALRDLAHRSGYILHACALGSAHGIVRMWNSGGAPSTGSSVVGVGEGSGSQCVEVTAETLDNLFASSTSIADRALLKLDLQGFELEALKGAAILLTKVEVILTEVSFFAQAYEPTIATLVAFLDRAGFELYDVVALSARRRDDRLKQGDFVFVRKDSDLLKDTAWA